MRLKLGLLALALTALGIGIPYYLDSQIPRATAVVEIYPSSLIPDIDPEARRGTIITGPNGSILTGR